MWKPIYLNAFKEEPELRINFKNLNKRINKLKSNIDYIINDNLKIGFGMLFRNKFIYNSWHLDYFAINPKYHSCGYGSLLLKNIINKYKKITLECDNHLVNYYKKFGFK